MFKNLIKIKKDMPTLLYAFFDRQTPLISKILLAVSVLYVVCPVDFVPDFVAGFGIVDDLLIAPSLILAAKKFVPEDVISNSEQKAEQLKERLKTTAVLITVATMLVIGWGLYKIIAK